MGSRDNVFEILPSPVMGEVEGSSLTWLKGTPKNLYIVWCR
jgi:hypothetical protein